MLTVAELTAIASGLLFVKAILKTMTKEKTICKIYVSIASFLSICILVEAASAYFPRADIPAFWLSENTVIVSGDRLYISDSDGNSVFAILTYYEPETEVFHAVAHPTSIDAVSVAIVRETIFTKLFTNNEFIEPVKSQVMINETEVVGILNTAPIHQTAMQIGTPKAGQAEVWTTAAPDGKYRKMQVNISEIESGKFTITYIGNETIEDVGFRQGYSGSPVIQNGKLIGAVRAVPAQELKDNGYTRTAYCAPLTWDNSAK